MGKKYDVTTGNFERKKVDQLKDWNFQIFLSTGIAYFVIRLIEIFYHW